MLRGVVMSCDMATMPRPASRASPNEAWEECEPEVLLDDERMRMEFIVRGILGVKNLLVGHLALLLMLLSEERLTIRAGRI